MQRNNQDYSYELIPFLAVDTRKMKFLKYIQAITFYELEYQRMNKAIAIGSKYVLKAKTMRLTKYNFNDECYLYYFIILDDEMFKIIYVELIENELVIIYGDIKD